MKILDYDSRFVIKNGKIVFRDGKMLVINSINSVDDKYNLLRQIEIPEIDNDDLLSSYIYLKIDDNKDYSKYNIKLYYKH